MSEDTAITGADIRSVRTALVGIALSIITAGVMVQGHDAFFFGVTTLLVLGVSFLQSLLQI